MIPVDLQILRHKKRKQLNSAVSFCTPYEEYFEHLNRFLSLIDPIIEDLERKKFI